MNENNIFLDKANFYLDKSISVHIQTKSGIFYNGLIISIDENSIILQDLKLGESYISFNEIKDIQPYKTKGDAK